MDEIQMNSFVKFINHHLSTKYNDEHLVKDLTTDLSNGEVFLDLIEIFSSTKLKRERGRTRFHALTNVQYVLDYLKLHIQHVNICPNEIVSGNRKQILALLWIIMKRFDFPSFRLTSTKHLFGEQTIHTGGHDRSRILRWFNHLLKKIFVDERIRQKDFHLSTWMNEKYLLELVKYFAPITGRCSTVEYVELLDRCQTNSQKTNEERFQSIFNLSNYVFQLDSTIDFRDRTEKSLLKYFSEIYSKCFHLVEIDDESDDEDYLIYAKDSSSTEILPSSLIFILFLSSWIVFISFFELISQ